MSDLKNYVWKAYQYTPSSVAAIVACTLFGIATAICLGQMIRALIKTLNDSHDKRQVLTHIPFVMGGLCEVVGYIARILSSKNPTSLGPFIVQSILLLVAPALFAATIYMTLGRIIGDLRCDNLSIIPLRWLTKIFVMGDVASFLLQGSGGGLQGGGTLNLLHLGEKMIIVGLFVQIAVFGFFIVVMSIFQFRVVKNPSVTSMETRHVPSRFRNWQTIIITLLACSLLIFIRSIVRVIEYIQGNSGTIISHEIFLYIFDGLMMFLNMVVFVLQDIGAYYGQFSSYMKQYKTYEFELHTREEFYSPIVPSSLGNVALYSKSGSLS